jgi:SPP1 gp7 family putative phage head morphogenesis protein
MVGMFFMANKRLIAVPPAPKKEMRQLEEIISAMVKKIFVTYKRRAFKYYKVRSVTDKARFKDALGGMEGDFLRESKRINKEMDQLFSKDKIIEMIEGLFNSSDEASRKAYYQSLSKAIGWDSGALMAREGLANEKSPFVIATADYIETLKGDTLKNITSSTLKMMSEGVSLEQAMRRLSGIAGASEARGKTIARTQISQYTGLMSKMRSEKLGITQGIWVTSNDERVRESHKDRQGKVFDLSKGCYSDIDKQWLIPGVDYVCRCVFKMVIPDNL